MHYNLWDLPLTRQTKRPILHDASRSAPRAHPSDGVTQRRSASCNTPGHTLQAPSGQERIVRCLDRSRRDPHQGLPVGVWRLREALCFPGRESSPSTHAPGKRGPRQVMSPQRLARPRDVQRGRGGYKAAAAAARRASSPMLLLSPLAVPRCCAALWPPEGSTRPCKPDRTPRQSVRSMK